MPVKGVTAVVFQAPGVSEKDKRRIMSIEMDPHLLQVAARRGFTGNRTVGRLLAAYHSMHMCTSRRCPAYLQAKLLQVNATRCFNWL